LELRERRLCKIRFSRGLARHCMTASWRCMMRAACCRLASSFGFLSQYFPIRVPPLDSHVPTISPRVSYLARLSCLALFCIAQSSHQTSSEKKSGSRNCRGTITNQRAKNPPVNLRPPRGVAPNSVAGVQNRVMYLGCAPFFGLSTWPPIDSGA
jgi:hypothetical protein